MTAAEVVAALSAAVLDLESALAAAHYQVQIAECKLMGDGAVTTRGGWCQLSRRSSLSVQNKVSPSLADFLTRNVFTGKTVGDFGAGNGFYSQVFNQSGLVRARAFDGMIGAELATDGLVEYLDLGAPVRVTDKVPMFDFVLSLEVSTKSPARHHCDTKAARCIHRCLLIPAGGGAHPQKQRRCLFR